jgi:hypothetical protein
MARLEMQEKMEHRKGKIKKAEKNNCRNKLAVHCSEKL